MAAWSRKTFQNFRFWLQNYVPKFSSPRQSTILETVYGTIDGYVTSGEASFTGWTASTGFSSESVFRCSSVYITWRLNIRRPSACQPVSSVPGRRHLRSADRGELDSPRINAATLGRRTFVNAGSTTWNIFDNHLENIYRSLATFKRHFKTFSSY